MASVAPLWLRHSLRLTTTKERQSCVAKGLLLMRGEIESGPCNNYCYQGFSQSLSIHQLNLANMHDSQHQHNNKTQLFICSIRKSHILNSRLIAQDLMFAIHKEGHSEVAPIQQSESLNVRVSVERSMAL